jgi:hypothetical protein
MQNPDLDCAVPGMYSARQIDELYEALQTPFSEEEREILAVMKKAMIDTVIDVQLRREGFEGLNKTIWD